MPNFKSFLLQLFFRETLNDQFVEKKTHTTTVSNNLGSICFEVFSGRFRGGEWGEEGSTKKPFILSISKMISKMQ